MFLFFPTVHFSLHHERKWKSVLHLFCIVIIWCISATQVSAPKQSFPSLGLSTLEMNCFQVRMWIQSAMPFCTIFLCGHLCSAFGGLCVPADFCCTQRTCCESPSLLPVAQTFSHHTSASKADMPRCNRTAILSRQDTMSLGNLHCCPGAGSLLRRLLMTSPKSSFKPLWLCSSQNGVKCCHQVCRDGWAQCKRWGGECCRDYLAAILQTMCL